MSVVRLGSRLSLGPPVSLGVKDSIVYGPYATAVLADSPLAYWAFQDTGSPSTQRDITQGLHNVNSKIRI